MFTQAFQSFDFALYSLHLTSKDCVIGISHRGNKIYTLESLRYAREVGCCTAIITGEGELSEAVKADFSFHTVAQEKSSAHTVSYVGTIAVLATLAQRIGCYQSGKILPTDSLHKELSEALQAVLTTESEIALLASKYLDRRRFWLVGGGPNTITANEIALKIKETSYLQAEGMSVETMLHGPFQCAEAEDIFILIAPVDAAQKRVFELAKLVKEISAAYLVISDTTDRSLLENAAGWITVPTVPEPFTTLTCLVPLQLFVYYLALERGTNPDNFRLDDSRFARARALVQL